MFGFCWLQTSGAAHGVFMMSDEFCDTAALNNHWDAHCVFCGQQDQSGSSGSAVLWSCQMSSVERQWRAVVSCSMNSAVSTLTGMPVCWLFPGKQDQEWKQWRAVCVCVMPDEFCHPALDFDRPAVEAVWRAVVMLDEVLSPVCVCWHSVDAGKRHTQKKQRF